MKCQHVLNDYLSTDIFPDSINGNELQCLKLTTQRFWRNLS